MKQFNRVVILGSGGFISNALEEILKKKDKIFSIKKEKIRFS